jgi:exopolyphosphatase/guanosine-5'-triphosphate,3'-diphosphate pyrophosphatase
MSEDSEARMANENMQIAAIDLGSNSFHMAIAHIEHGEIRIQERFGEKVQLAAGLDKQGNLDDESISRAIDCLKRFEQRLRTIDRDYIQIVGTNALRVARNRKQLTSAVEDLLGVPIEVISGREEARLIYLGVAHTLADDEGQRLVIDIGGGSTEFVIGKRFESLERESLHMGCVSYREAFFKEGVITKQNFAQAVARAERELLPIKKQYKKQGWQSCVGSSGSIKAVFQALGKDENRALTVDLKELKQLREKLIQLGHIDQLEQLNIKKERWSIFPAGLSIMLGAFRALDIESMEFSDGALREGLLYDIVGRISHEDVRDRSISALQQRYGVDLEHSAYVACLSKQLYAQVCDDWKIHYPKWKNLLTWAAQVFEVGLAIAHSQYQKHGAYLIQNSDLSGFSNVVQSQLALLVRSHRRKIPTVDLPDLAKHDFVSLQYLMVLLRLSILLAADREYSPVPITLGAGKMTLEVSFEEGWIESHPLTAANLEHERYYLKKIGFALNF